MKIAMFIIGLLAVCLLAENVAAMSDCGCEIAIPEYHQPELNLTVVQSLVEAITDKYVTVDVSLEDGQFEVVVQQPEDYAGTGLVATITSHVNGETVETNSTTHQPYIEANGWVHLYVDVPEGADGNFFVTVAGDKFFGQYQAFANYV